MSRANFYSGRSIKENIREDVNFYSGQSIKEKIQVNKDALTSCLNVQGLRPHLTGMGVVDQRMMDSIVQVNITYRSFVLLPFGSEQHEVLLFGSI